MQNLSEHELTILKGLQAIYGTKVLLDALESADTLQPKVTSQSEKAVVQHRRKHRVDDWTTEELNLLVEKYKDMGFEIPELLKRHSLSDIRYKARDLGLVRPCMRWTVEEVELLKREYPKHGTKIPVLREVYTPKQISAKANGLGLVLE